MGRGWIGAVLFAGALAALLLAASTASVGDAASARHHSAFAGLGTWVDIYSPEWADPEAAVTSMAKHGVKTLYLETGNYSHAAPVFRPADAGRFIDAAHKAGLRVVAWYLPSFLNVRIDAAKAMGAIRFRSANGERFDAFALDIEATKVRSFALRNRRLLALSGRIRTHVHRRYQLGAITPSPVGMSPSYWPEIPYRSLTRYYQAFLPMAYFTLRGIHGRSAARTFLTSTASDIRTASGDPKLPVHLIAGMSRSMGAQATAGLVDAVAQTKSFGLSLYTFGQTTPAAWRVLARR